MASDDGDETKSDVETREQMLRKFGCKLSAKSGRDPVRAQVHRNRFVSVSRPAYVGHDRRLADGPWVSRRLPIQP
jgi:hypothetical protein